MSSFTNRLIFFFSFIVIALFYTGKTIERLWTYYTLDQSTTAENVQWSILHQRADAFSPHATYQFVVGDQLYSGMTTLQEKYLNAWTAEEAIQRQPYPLTVWYKASSPAVSSLEKIFPYKDFFYMLTLWFLGFYFWMLNQYLLKKQFHKEA